MVDVAGLHGFSNADISSTLSISHSEAARRISREMARWPRFLLNSSLNVSQRVKNSTCGHRRAYIPNGLELVKHSPDLTTNIGIIGMTETASLALANCFQRQEKEAIQFSMLSMLPKFNTRTTV